MAKIAYEMQELDRAQQLNGGLSLPAILRHRLRRRRCRARGRFLRGGDPPVLPDTGPSGLRDCLRHGALSRAMATPWLSLLRPRSEPGDAREGARQGARAR